MTSDTDQPGQAGTERLDKAVFTRGLAASRERARQLVEAGLVEVNGSVVMRPSAPVGPGDEVNVTGEALPYVGRGGLKLEAALKHFRINASGARCLDVGASTGGFTDCLLQRGASHVVALDVGHSQLAEQLLADPRVTNLEGVNARHLTQEIVPGPFDMVVVDVSFISLTLVLPAIAPLVRPGGYILALIKPEFEAGREAVDTRGIVRDRAARTRAIDRVCDCAQKELGLDKSGVLPLDPVRGRNREYFACFRTARAVVEAPAERDGAPEAPDEASGE